MMRTALVRATRRSVLSTPARCVVPVCMQSRQAHAISNPTLANIETRWEAMPPQEQADLWMALRDRMKVDWSELTLQEKKAAYWIAFGPHGPRREAPAGEGWRIFRGVIISIVASGVLFYAVRLGAPEAPKTMSKEWQEKTNEYLKKNKVEPITGISSEGYKGVGMVQSATRGLTEEQMGEPAEDEDEE